jgi:hypothetical protein
MARKLTVKKRRRRPGEMWTLYLVYGRDKQTRRPLPIGYLVTTADRFPLPIAFVADTREARLRTAQAIDSRHDLAATFAQRDLRGCRTYRGLGPVGGMLLVPVDSLGRPITNRRMHQHSMMYLPKHKSRKFSIYIDLVGEWKKEATAFQPVAPTPASNRSDKAKLAAA